MFERESWLKLKELCLVDSLPNLPCPYCGSNSLVFDSDSLVVRPLSGLALDTFLEKFSYSRKFPLSREAMTWIDAAVLLSESFDKATNAPSHFLGFFCCKLCGQSVSSMGFAKIPVNNSSGQVMIKVEGFNPAIPIIPTKHFVPKSISKELIKSFGYYHSDVCASGNMLRRAVERTCAELGHKQRSLHASIESFKQEYPDEGMLLEALKLVGNEATHSDGVTEEDILDSYEVISLVLEIFRRKEVHKKAQGMAKRLSLKYNEKKKLGA